MKHWSRIAKIVYFVLFILAFSLEALLVFQIPRSFIANAIFTIAVWIITGAAALFMNGAGDVSNGTPFPGVNEFPMNGPVYSRLKRRALQRRNRKKLKKSPEE